MKILRAHMWLTSLVFILAHIKVASSKVGMVQRFKIQDLGQCRVQLHTEAYLGGKSHFLNGTSNGHYWWKSLGRAASVRSLTTLAVGEPCCVILFRNANFKGKRAKLATNGGELVEYKKIEHEVGFKPKSIRIHHKKCSQLRKCRRRKGNCKRKRNRKRKG